MKSRVGTDMWYTAKIAADRINENGGIKVGNTVYKIELIKKDTNEYVSIFDAAAVAEEAILLDKVDFLIGGNRLEAVQAIREKAMDHKKIYISATYTTPDELVTPLKRNYERYKYWFSIGGGTYSNETARNYVDLIKTVAGAVRNETGIQKVKIAVLFERRADDTVFNLQMGEFQKDPGIEIVGIWRPSPTAADLRSELTAIQATKAHILYAVFSGVAGTVLGKQFKELKIPMLLAGSPGSLVGDAQVPYQIVMLLFGSEELEDMGAFLKEYRSLAGPGVESPVATLYEGVWTLAQAIELAGTTEPGAVIKALETGSFKTLYGGKWKDRGDHTFRFEPGWEPACAGQWIPSDGGFVLPRPIVWVNPSGYLMAEKITVQNITIPQSLKSAWLTQS
ncbi:MAG: ABC transporter substrate-binding protein [Archaeoglobaceae archaeon]